MKKLCIFGAELATKGKYLWSILFTKENFIWELYVSPRTIVNHSERNNPWYKISKFYLIIVLSKYNQMIWNFELFLLSIEKSELNSSYTFSSPNLGLSKDLELNIIFERNDMKRLYRRKHISLHITLHFLCKYICRNHFKMNISKI